MAVRSKLNRKRVKRDSSCDCPSGALREMKEPTQSPRTANILAKLTEGFEETKPRPSSQASSIRLRRSDISGMATISGESAVSDRAFATIFDIPLFGQLDGSQRACFSTGTEIRVEARETLINDGNPADVFCVMLEGELRVTEYYGEQEIFLAEVIPGEFFSEIEILLDVPHSVLYRAVADSRLFRLPRAGFWDLLRCSPLVAREIMRTLATRLRNYESYSQEREKLI